MNKSSNIAFEKVMKEFTREASKSKESARDTLINEGIYTKSGRLSKNYTSKKPKKAA
jgi:hypothetical protein